MLEDLLLVLILTKVHKVLITITSAPNPIWNMNLLHY